MWVDPRSMYFFVCATPHHKAREDNNDNNDNKKKKVDDAQYARHPSDDPPVLQAWQLFFICLLVFSLHLPNMNCHCFWGGLHIYIIIFCEAKNGCQATFTSASLSLRTRTRTHRMGTHIYSDDQLTFRFSLGVRGGRTGDVAFDIFP